jgi:thiamine biosynthesis lipoprotein
MSHAPGATQTASAVTLECHVPAMGGNAHLIAVADHPDNAERAVSGARRRLCELEDRWSRFRPDSEIARLGRNAGRPLAVSADTRLLITCAVRATQHSRGAFDPTVIDALERHGYDRSFELMEFSPAPHPTPAGPRPQGWPGDVIVDEDAGTVRLPPGIRLDAGGIGKGLAADLVAECMIATGASGACVNLSGDVRARGLGPDADPRGWTIGIEHPLHAGEQLALVHLPPAGGGVASSSVLQRRWGPGLHHVIDPDTTAPAASDVIACTLVADAAVWADAFTKMCFRRVDPGKLTRQLEALDVAALIVRTDRTVHATRGHPFQM